MVHGLLYFTGKFSAVYAVDARTGNSLRGRSIQKLAKSLPILKPDELQLGNKSGVAYWKGTSWLRC